MNYLDVYFSRVNHFGETPAERIKNSGIVAFEKWMAQSPFTVIDLSVERGLYFSGIIQTSKDKEEIKIMYLYVANDIPIQVGDILTWRQDNGVVEKWLLLQKIHKVHEQYQTFQMVKCNYNLKWIDEEGYLHQSWAYAVSSVDSKVKGNFRMWHSLISPQPNKFAEIIMPRPIIKKGTADYDQLMRGITFIIENEGWIVIECDWTSVEGIVYMSLTESKVNYQYDDRDIDVADTDRYKFPTLSTQFKVDETVIPQFETGTLNQWEIELRPSNFDLFNEEKETLDEEEKWYSELHPAAAGTCIITMRLKNRHAVTKDIEITINPSDQELIAYIEGPDQLRLDRQDKYYLFRNIPMDANSKVTFVVKSWPNMDKKQCSDYVVLRQDMDDNNNLIPNQYILHANAHNNLGNIVLEATYTVMENDQILSQQVYTKTIKIIPLW